MESSDCQIAYRFNFGWLRLLRLNQCTSLLAIALIVALPCNILLQANSAIAQETIAQSPTLTKDTIYVNPKNGDDSQTGKKTSPLKTITQALKTALAGSTIQLASGTYSEDTGETFPLVIKNQITLQGDSKNQGYKTIIQGDGYFLSPTGAGQNIAIAAVKDAGGIMGITVTNNHSRGHGIWIESANPLIVSNTLTRNGNTGVSVNGKSSPTIKDNYFYNNSGNGLLVYGTSSPEVVNNTFEQTGFGVSVVQNATPVISGNLFDGNRIGIILEGNSQGTFRDNEIINSDESGLTAIAQSRVDLGTDNEPGNNVFRSNKKLDIQNATSNQIVAVGTETQGEIQGDINFDSGTFIASNVASNNNNDNTFRDLPPLPSRNIVKPSIPQTIPEPVEVEAPSNLPSPPPIIADNTGNKELVFTPAASSSAAVPNVEPVPFPPQIASTSSVSLVKYKVLVETLSESEENEVRSLYPEAFKTIFQGQPWLQVGAFSNWDKAKKAEENLGNLGLATYLLE
jgi:parallel beta-helix repeat protein